MNMGFLWGWNRSLLFERFEIEAWGTFKKKETNLWTIATLALGSQPRQKGYKVVGQKEAHESHHIFPGM